ncbi:MAG: glycosyltransferase [Firmicutes bacterium HGW-Firmicutes-9]|jgi:dolichol-phosphate mannosyltransferase|nr:MAG: glycosyltransferase [Firmicutes bacterium HGW-Firmicutes-9]
MESNKQHMLSLIIPVFNEQEVLKDSFARMDAAMQSTGYTYEIIYINDGSRDQTLAQLRDLAKEHPQVKVLSFSRNFGHQLAVTCGMDAAKGDALIIIDVDLQDPPELIPEMVRMWEAGADIVYGKRVKRKGETIFKKLTASLYYRLLSWMSAYPIPLDTGDFRLIGRNVADVFLQMREHNRFLRGMSAWMGYNAVPIEYERQERFAGQTKYTLKKMLRLASDGITGFSDKPLTLPMTFGILLMLLSGFGLVALIVLAIVSGVAPWLWALAGVVFVQGISLFFMGVQGMYLGRMYDELKGRPLYIVSEKHNID